MRWSVFIYETHCALPLSYISDAVDLVYDGVRPRMDAVSVANSCDFSTADVFPARLLTFPLSIHREPCHTALRLLSPISPWVEIQLLVFLGSPQMAERPRVALDVETSLVYGRRILDGI